MLYPLFVDFDESGLGKKLKHKSFLFKQNRNENAYIYVRKQCNSIDFDDILPLLKRIVIVDNKLDKIGFKLFLTILKDFILKRGIEIYFPKLDHPSIERLFYNETDIHTPSVHYDNENENERSNRIGSTLNSINDESSYFQVISPPGSDSSMQRVASNVDNQQDYVFEWNTWKRYLFASRLSLERWRDSEHFWLYAKCTNWNFWWWKDIHYTWESYKTWM